MTTMTNITEAQLAQIRLRAINETTRHLAKTGALLTYEQADELGDEVLDWLRTRLDMIVDTSDTEQIELRPAPHR